MQTLKSKNAVLTQPSVGRGVRLGVGRGARQGISPGFKLGIGMLVGLIVASLLSYSSSQAQIPIWGKSRAELGKRIQDKFLELRKDHEFPGVNIGIATPDGRSFAVAVGYSDLESKTPMKPSDRMLAGSIGKTFLSALMLQLVEERKVNLDDKIETWLSHEGWFGHLPNANTITLRMLMNHTSGLPEYVLKPDFIRALRGQPDKVWKPEELLAFILDSKPLFEAGQGWSYAETNYILVGVVFERVTGKPFYTEVQRLLLGPLKLKETAPSDSRSIAELIPGYVSANGPFGFEGRTITNGKFIINPQMEWAGGGFVSTAEDLAKWARALYEGRVLGGLAMSYLLDAVPAKTGNGDKYGLGVQVRESDWGTSYGHGGWFPGYLSEMEYFPERKTAIAIQFNTDDFDKLKMRPREYVAEVAQIVFAK